uniref:Cyclic nucleotide-binding domain-containing protein n=1 Tax=Cryptomonas curvata TaxID=233186 RepID=A0A7S0M6N4_9CRYP|mmetsp:Transcript_27199/g.56515  ORF Transcript_27199/g.56515 Transcript_27199/m.56515 type:complete len:566 (+) Transcript_27199:194-1891(+)
MDTSGCVSSANATTNEDSNYDLNRPTLPFDMLVDLFFMLEICYRCLLVGRYRGGRYCDDFRMVARSYLASPTSFWFDAATSIPVSWLDWGLEQTCGGQSMQSVRAVRMLRPFKLIRILKLLRIDSNRVIERVHEASPVAFKLIKILVAMAAAVHMAACASWRAQKELNPELKDYLATFHIQAQDQDDEYVWSFYFACSVFTTVGFGDITARNSEERVFVIFLMVISVGFFGTLLSQLQDMLMRLRRDGLSTDEYLNSVSSLLRSARVPRHFEEQVKSWVRYTVANERLEKQRHAVLDSLPKYLREGLALGLDGGLFSKINIFSTIQNATLKGEFTARLVKYVHNANFLAGTVIADAAQVADQVMIITAGTVWITLPTPASERGSGPVLARLRIGDSIGDNSVLGDNRWGGAYGVDLDFTASDNCSVIYLRTADIQAVLTKQRFSAIRTSWQRIASLREVHNPSVVVESSERRATFQRSSSSSGFIRPSAFSNGSASHCSAFRSNLNEISPTVVFFWIYLARKSLICRRRSGEQWRDSSDLIISQVLGALFASALKLCPWNGKFKN